MADNKGSGQASKRSRWYRLGCWIWFRITVLLLVVSLLVAYSVEVFRCSSFESTGDALYDRYAKTVISRQKWVLFHGGKHHPTYLPDDLLAKWEGEFGSDPRYWQLRYFCARNKDASQGTMEMMELGSIGWLFPWSGEPTEKEKEAWRYLEQACKNGKEDWQSLCYVNKKKQELADSDFNKKLEEIEDRGLEGQARRQAIVALNAEAEEAELNRLNEVVDLAPDQAWPYYRRANYWFKFGELENAQIDLERGNSAKYHENPIMFPHSFVEQQVDLGNIPGSKILFGAIAQDYDEYYLGYKIFYKDNVRISLVGSALGGDTALLDAIFHFACKSGAAEFGDSLDSLVSATMLSLIANEMVLSLDDGSTSEQRRVLLNIGNTGLDIKTEWVKAGECLRTTGLASPRQSVYIMLSEGLLKMQIDLDGFPDYTKQQALIGKLEYLFPSRYYDYVWWRYEYSRFTFQQQANRLELLDKADLTTLEWPEDWSATNMHILK